MFHRDNDSVLNSESSTSSSEDELVPELQNQNIVNIQNDTSETNEPAVVTPSVHPSQPCDIKIKGIFF